MFQNILLSHVSYVKKQKNAQLLNTFCLYHIFDLFVTELALVMPCELFDMILIKTANFLEMFFVFS